MFKESIKTEGASEWELNAMAETLQAIKDGEMYAQVMSVSRSGMSRKICFYYVKDNQIQRATPQVAWLCGAVKVGVYLQGNKYLTDEGLRVGGCGMDMIFHTLYNCMPYEDAKNWSQRYNRL
jgi:hypothetical protein